MYLEFGKCKAGSASAAAAPSGPSEPVESKAAATAADASDVAMICPEDEAEATIEEEVDPLQAEASAKAASQMDHVFIYTHERDFEQALAKNVRMLQQSLGVSVSMQFFLCGRMRYDHTSRSWCSTGWALSSTARRRGRR